MLEQLVPLPEPFAAVIGAEEAPRHVVESIIEQLIATLDAADGDPDLEPDGDEHDGNGAEDEECGWHRRYGNGPGCSIADPDREPEDLL